MNAEHFMRRALELAQAAVHLTPPNPSVGAVLVRDGRILATGVHRGPGQAHAELAAIDQAREAGLNVAGSTLFVTLEPCCHSGGVKRTPPCAQRVVSEGIAEVWIACRDPNPAVSGRGVALLRAAGIRVQEGLLAAEAQALIADFSVWIRKGRPVMHLKWAQSLDGKAAALDGSSRWISGEESRAEAHRLRAAHDAVLIGAQTLRVDDPALTVRLENQADGPVRAPQPVRLVMAGERALPSRARLFSDEWREKTWIIAREGSAPAAQATELVGNRLVSWDGRDWAALGRRLLEQGWHRILVEGGPKLLGTCLERGWADRISVFIAPLLLGSGAGVPGDFGVASLAQGRRLASGSWQRLGPDMLYHCADLEGAGLELLDQEAPCSPA